MQHTWVLGIRIRKIIHIHVTTITCMTSTSVNKNLMQLNKRRAIWEYITSYRRSGLPCIKNRLEIQYYFKTMKNSWSILSTVKLESLTFTFNLFFKGRLTNILTLETSIYEWKPWQQLSILPISKELECYF